MDKRAKLHLWYVLFAILGVIVVQYLWHYGQQIATIPYSEFQTLLDQGKVDDITVTDTYITGTLKQPTEHGATRFVTTRVDPAIADELARRGVRFTGARESNWLGEILSWIVPMLLFFGLWMFVFRRIAEKQGFGGLMSVGKSKARIYVETDTKTTFDDVAGVDEAKEELKEIVDFLKDPKSHGVLGARPPKGVLLVGPPGTGKTLIARAVAGEAGVPFFSISGSEFVEMFVGVGAARVRDLFEQAKARAPAIIFIDELDALGRARGAFGLGGGHDEKEQTLNQLLVEMDGFDPREGVVILAATNRPEILDPALLRAGRFDRQVLIGRPDRVGREQILNVHLKKIRLAPDVSAEQIAALTPGFTGADLANLVNEAALLATRRGAKAVTMTDFTAAIERIVAGLEKKNRLLNPKEREVVAYHEMGHALVAMSIPGADPVHKISIIPRSIGSLGYTIQRPTEDRYLMTREELENKMTVLLGGRAAEYVVFDHLSTGAADDLVKVTDIARSMVMRYGMDPRLGHIAYEAEPSTFLTPPPGGYSAFRSRTYGEATADEIDRAVHDLVQGAFDRAVSFLNARREVLEKGARLLLEKETLAEGDLRALREELHGATAAAEPEHPAAPAPRAMSGVG
ncbi:MAG: ATP-dependent zinc metalloprotease FtsH [Rhodospirillaceae bacterium]|nr:ATP-dependent zinc metalloprotease FtsH [Rhodospirillaceae bacterium]